MKYEYKGTEYEINEENEKRMETKKQIIEELGWTISEEDERTLTISRYTDAGEDFSVTLDKPYLDESAQCAYEDFDPEDHVLMWLEAKKNGIAGVPDVFALVEDAKWIDKELETLAISLAQGRVLKEDDFSIASAMRQERECVNKIEQLVFELTEQISNAVLNGVEKIDENTVSVKSSAVFANGSLAPEYYIQSAQADLVKNALSGSEYVADVDKKLRDMIATGSVRVKGCRHRLNPNTISVLKRAIGGETGVETEVPS